MGEIWKDIQNYEGSYQVSNYGRIKSLNYNRTRKEKILKPGKDKSGYFKINLYKNGKYKTYQVHRLVAEAFILNPNNHPIINHKDENPSNNHVDNLEWCTYKYNNNYGNRNEKLSKSNKGRIFSEETIKKMSEAKKGKYDGNKHPQARKVICITTGETFNCIKDAEEKYGIHHQDISKCCKNKRKSAGKHPVTSEKLTWRYLNYEK